MLLYGLDEPGELRADWEHGGSSQGAGPDTKNGTKNGTGIGVGIGPEAGARSGPGLGKAAQVVAYAREAALTPLPAAVTCGENGLPGGPDDPLASKP